MSEENLAKKINDYQELAKENPNIDVNLLMMNALQTSTKEQAAAGSHRWAYLISLGFPPFGLIYAVKYYISGEDDLKQAAKVCVLLTVISIIMFFAFAKFLFSSSGVSTDQLQQINVKQMQQDILQ